MIRQIGSLQSRNPLRATTEGGQQRAAVALTELGAGAQRRLPPLRSVRERGVWQETGRGAVATWPSLLEFLLQHETGVIFIDELDKLAGASEWTTYLRSELYSLLDRTVPTDLIRAANLSSDLPPANPVQKVEQARAQVRLRRGMLLVAAGAFQSVWEQSERRAVGFRSDAGGHRHGRDRSSAR